MGNSMVINETQTILDILSENESLVEVFNAWNDRAGLCICCEALFETLETVIERYKLDGEKLINELRNYKS